MRKVLAPLTLVLLLLVSGCISGNPTAARLSPGMRVGQIECAIFRTGNRYNRTCYQKRYDGMYAVKVTTCFQGGCDTYYPNEKVMGR